MKYPLREWLALVYESGSLHSAITIEGISISWLSDEDRKAFPEMTAAYEELYTALLECVSLEERAWRLLREADNGRTGEG